MVSFLNRSVSKMKVFELKRDGPKAFPFPSAAYLLHHHIEALQERDGLQVADVAVLIGDPLPVFLPEVTVDP